MKSALLRLVSMLVLGIASTACASAPSTAADLERKPESHLFYPGSNLISTSRQDEALTAAGTSAATVRNELAVKASSDEIYKWYVQQLKAKGWTLQVQRRVDGGYDLFTRGNQEVFEVAVNASAGTYAIAYSTVPAPCATTPPTKYAFSNCG